MAAEATTTSAPPADGGDGGDPSDADAVLADEAHDDETTPDAHEGLSDETVERLLRLVVVFVIVAALVAGFIAAAGWALAGDDVPPVAGTVDIGYLQDMIDHHEQALLIADAYLANNPEGDAAPYASEVIMFQERDIGRMEAALDDAGFGRGVPRRTAMVWMSDPYPVDQMPGMQGQERIAELSAATGRDADRLFFAMMSEHHLGGVHMADYAADFADTEAVRVLAERTSYNQQIEVVEYDRAVERLGLGSI